MVKIKKGVVKVGKWHGSYYSRYNRSRDPGSGIQWVNRYKIAPGTHVYGADYSARRKSIRGETFRGIKKPIRIWKRKKG